MVKKKVTCWTFFKCDEKECPVYLSKELRCWLVSGTRCRKGIQGKFIEKMEMCLECELFKANVDVDSIQETLKVISEQLTESKKMVEARDRELEGISMELALSLSEVFEALRRISLGDPDVRIPETSGFELISKLKHMVNLTAQELSEIITLSHEFAMALAEHFDVLFRVSEGDLTARVFWDSQVELLQSLKKITNQMIENISKEIVEHRKTGEKLRKRTGDLSERVKELDCLYSISKLVAMPGLSLDKMLQGIVDLIPGSWQHPDIVCARIVLKDQKFKTENFKGSARKLISGIIANGQEVGILEVGYLTQGPTADDGPYPSEEKSLINAIAQRTGRIIERKLADEEKEKLENQLIQASKMSSIGEMAAGVAHEINNPIAVILGFTELLLERFSGDSKERTILKAIERQGDNCKRIVENLLAFSRIPKTTTPETDVAHDLQRALGVAKNALLVNMVDLKIEIEEDLPKVSGDGRQMEQVYLNIVNNAVAAMEGGGVLTVSARRFKDHVRIRFADTGHGISTRDKSRIFEPFFTTKEPGKGTGLGLSLSYALVKKFGGNIRVKSQTGDKGQEPGTTFSVMLPVAHPQNHAEKGFVDESHHSPTAKD